MIKQIEKIFIEENLFNQIFDFLQFNDEAGKKSKLNGKCLKIVNCNYWDRIFLCHLYLIDMKGLKNTLYHISRLFTTADASYMLWRK